MPESTTPSMRERTRRIVQSELTTVAQDLFLQNGFESTTVEQIAAAAGMSKRTFFRHFATKEALVIGKYELFGDRMAEALQARPKDEPLWESLRRIFEITEVYFDDGPEKARNEAMERIVRSSPGLYAAYLEKFARMQELVAQVAAERLKSPRDRALRSAVIVGSAFACLSAAGRAWAEVGNTKPFRELLDEAMATVSVG